MWLNWTSPVPFQSPIIFRLRCLHACGFSDHCWTTAILQNSRVPCQHSHWLCPKVIHPGHLGKEKHNMSVLLTCPSLLVNILFGYTGPLTLNTGSLLISAPLGLMLPHGSLWVSGLLSDRPLPHAFDTYTSPTCCGYISQCHLQTSQYSELSASKGAQSWGSLRNLHLSLICQLTQLVAAAD